MMSVLQSYLVRVEEMIHHIINTIRPSRASEEGIGGLREP